MDHSNPRLPMSPTRHAGPTPPTRRWLLLVMAVASTLVACAPSSTPRFESNGERIYRTGTSASGERIEAAGFGPRGMHRLTCAACHGVDGSGGRTHIMMRNIEAPDITWNRLTQPHGDDGHGEHPPYTETSLRRAIRAGLDPAGEPLDDDMPRFRISDADLDDLIDFLKTLGADDHEGG